MTEPGGAQRHDFRCQVVGCRVGMRFVGVDEGMAQRVWALASQQHQCVSPPAQWPPLVGDVWEDGDGALWAVRSWYGNDGVEFVPLTNMDETPASVEQFLAFRLPANLRSRVDAGPVAGAGS